MQQRTYFFHKTDLILINLNELEKLFNGHNAFSARKCLSITELFNCKMIFVIHFFLFSGKK